MEIIMKLFDVFSLTVLLWSSIAETTPEAIYTRADLPHHQLRIRSTDESLCAGSTGLAGYLDISTRALYAS